MVRKIGAFACIASCIFNLAYGYWHVAFWAGIAALYAVPAAFPLDATTQEPQSSATR